MCVAFCVVSSYQVVVASLLVCVWCLCDFPDVCLRLVFNIVLMFVFVVPLLLSCCYYVVFACCVAFVILLLCCVYIIIVCGLTFCLLCLCYCACLLLLL